MNMPRKNVRKQQALDFACSESLAGNVETEEKLGCLIAPTLVKRLYHHAAV
jgi:hypothetical protein